MNKQWTRARNLVSIGQIPAGKFNAITDVEGVLIGHSTLIRGEGVLIPGKGPVRTGVTAILPHGGNMFSEKVTAVAEIINGFGKSIGLAQIRELGTLETPILLTNTLNVGRVSDALITYMLKSNPTIGINTGTINPVVGECNDGYLNDIQGRHVSEEAVFQAISTAKSGRVSEGGVGAGTGMYCFHFKGGVGSSSRIVEYQGYKYTVGILVVSNFGRREELVIAGVPVGNELLDWPNLTRDKADDGSIMVILATDAPLSSRQLGRLARRVPLGLARTGSIASHGSGDFVIGFSTTHRLPHLSKKHRSSWERIIDENKIMNMLFLATIEAVEEAVLNSLFAAETIIGRDGNTAYALPIELVKEILIKYGRG